MEKYPLLLLVEAVLAHQSNHFLISPSPTIEPELCPPYCDSANQGKETHSKLHMNGLRMQHRVIVALLKKKKKNHFYIFSYITGISVADNLITWNIYFMNAWRTC